MQVESEKKSQIQSSILTLMLQTHTTFISSFCLNYKVNFNLLPKTTFLFFIFWINTAMGGFQVSHILPSSTHIFIRSSSSTGPLHSFKWAIHTSHWSSTHPGRNTARVEGRIFLYIANSEHCTACISKIASLHLSSLPYSAN